MYNQDNKSDVKPIIGLVISSVAIIADILLIIGHKLTTSMIAMGYLLSPTIVVPALLTFGLLILANKLIRTQYTIYAEKINMIIAVSHTMLYLSVWITCSDFIPNIVRILLDIQP